MATYGCWKQSDARTCGAACLMVALARAEPPSVERELEIWRYANNGSDAIPGSFPGRLALYARSHGSAAVLVEDRARLDAIARVSVVRPGIDSVRALREHDDYVRQAERQGIVVTRAQTSLAHVVDLAANASVLMLVSTGADIEGLHWVLVQHRAQLAPECTVMDPALGRNFSGSFEVFRHHFEAVHPFAGVVVAVTPRPLPADNERRTP